MTALAVGLRFHAAASPSAFGTASLGATPFHLDAESQRVVAFRSLDRPPVYTALLLTPPLAAGDKGHLTGTYHDDIHLVAQAASTGVPERTDAAPNEREEVMPGTT